jgi:hypothetical protein
MSLKIPDKMGYIPKLEEEFNSVYEVEATDPSC